MSTQRLPFLLLLFGVAVTACVYDGQSFSGVWHDNPELRTVWVVYKVDPLNIGSASSYNGIHELTMHDWVFSGEHFMSLAQLPTALLGPGEAWTENVRERICRICLRHEFVAEKMLPPLPPPMLQFDSLGARLMN